MNWADCKAVDRNPKKMGGVWCFAGTRMPVASLFDHLEHGSTVAEFLEWFPDMDPEQINEVLRFTKESLATPATAA